MTAGLASIANILHSVGVATRLVIDHSTPAIIAPFAGHGVAGGCVPFGGTSVVVGIARDTLSGTKILRRHAPPVILGNFPAVAVRVNADRLTGIRLTAYLSRRVLWRRVLWRRGGQEKSADDKNGGAVH